MPVFASKPRRAVALLVIALTAGAVTTAHADIQSQIDASRAHDQALQGSIGADSQKIHGFQGRVDDLRARLFAVQSTLSTEAAELDSLQTRLRGSRARLTRLRLAAKRDQRILSDQLVAQYEAPHPDLIDVILQAHGF